MPNPPPPAFPHCPSTLRFPRSRRKLCNSGSAGPRGQLWQDAPAPEAADFHPAAARSISGSRDPRVSSGPAGSTAAAPHSPPPPSVPPSLRRYVTQEGCASSSRLKERLASAAGLLASL